MSDNLTKTPSSGPATAGKRRPYALKFISGKYQGGEFALPSGKDVVVGRSSDLEMVLVEDMVSRRHARLFWEAEQLNIEDLGSTNGTFVNGEKIKKASLKEGDRVLIGTSILKVIAADQPVQVERAKQDLEGVAAAQRTSQVRTMSGAIDEIPLPDLLQLLSSSKKSGVLVIRTEEDVGKIYLRKGGLYFAIINDLEEVSPLKSLFRLLTWQKGLFDFDPPDETKFENEIDVSVPELLMEGLRQLDEFAAVRDVLPDMRARIAVPSPLQPPLRNLDDAELDVLQLAYNFGTVGEVMNKSAALDLETGQILAKLLKQGYVIRLLAEGLGPLRPSRSGTRRSEIDAGEELVDEQGPCVVVHRGEALERWSSRALAAQGDALLAVVAEGDLRCPLPHAAAR
jgi:pSer/pThr/pTyr-binding forkhead associated (FHA) protein